MFQALYEFYDGLLAEKNKYGVPDYRVDQIVLRETDKYLQPVINVARYALPDIENMDAFRALRKHETVDVRVGEYFDMTHSVYCYDARPHRAEDVRLMLGNKVKMRYQTYRNLQLAGGSYEESDLLFCDFSGSNFAGSDFSRSKLIGTAWRRCNLDGVNFSGCDLSGADFRNAFTEQTIFEDAVLSNTVWR
jgi:hypothetical protein